LEEMLEDIQSALDALSNQDLEQYYRKEFTLLTAGEAVPLLTFEKLLQWSLIQEMLTNDELSQQRLRDVWFILPKDNMTITKPGKGYSPPKQVEAIDVEGFVALNKALDEDSAGTFDLAKERKPLE
jgi:hypothetical protein